MNKKFNYLKEIITLLSFLFFIISTLFNLSFLMYISIGIFIFNLCLFPANYLEIQVSRYKKWLDNKRLLWKIVEEIKSYLILFKHITIFTLLTCLIFLIVIFYLDSILADKVNDIYFVILGLIIIPTINFVIGYTFEWWFKFYIPKKISMKFLSFLTFLEKIVFATMIASFSIYSEIIELNINQLNINFHTTLNPIDYKIALFFILESFYLSCYAHRMAIKKNLEIS